MLASFVHGMKAVGLCIGIDGIERLLWQHYNIASPNKGQFVINVANLGSTLHFKGLKSSERCPAGTASGLFVGQR
jgi:hypothetical protein